MKNETSGDILYIIKQHHTKNRMSAAAFIVESSLDKVSWSYAEFRYNQTYGIATLMSKDPYTVGMHRVLSTHYKCGDAKSMW